MTRVLVLAFFLGATSAAAANPSHVTYESKPPRFETPVAVLPRGEGVVVFSADRMFDPKTAQSTALVNQIDWAASGRERIYLGGMALRNEDASWIGISDAAGRIAIRKLIAEQRLTVKAAAVHARGVYLVANYWKGILIINVSDAGDVVRTTGVATKEGDAHAVMAFPDGDLLVAYHDPFPALARFSAAGQLMWNKRYGMCGSIDALALGGDGNVYATMQCASARSVLKFDPSGGIVWARGLDMASIVDIASVDDDAVVFGTQVRGDGTAGVLARIGSDGEVQWGRTFGLVGERLNRGGHHDRNLLVIAKDTISVAAVTPDIMRAQIVTVSKDGSGACGISSAKVRTTESPLIGEPTEIKYFALEVSTQSTAPPDAAAPEAAVVREVPCASASAAGGSDYAAEFEVLLDQQRDVEESVRKAFAADRFEEVDALAERHRKDGSRYSPTGWNLTAVYTSFEDIQRGLPPDAWNAKMRRWLDERPQSIAARVVMAERGCRSGLADAGALLEAARKLGDDPHIDGALVTCGLLSPAAIASRERDPIAYPFTYIRAAELIAGSPDEFHDFAERTSELTRTAIGEILYARLAFIALASGGDHPNEAYRLDPARVREGFRQQIAAMPGWLETWHRYAAWAVMAGDRKTARELFATPQLAWSSHPRVVAAWQAGLRLHRGNPLEVFRDAWSAARRWANLQPAAFASQPPASWPRIDAATLTPRSIRQISSRAASLSRRRRRQTVAPCEIVGSNAAEFTVTSDAPLEAVMGATVVDENGHLLGIVTGRPAFSQRPAVTIRRPKR